MRLSRSPAVPAPLSRNAVRALLLGAVGVGLLGLALPVSSPGTSTVGARPAALTDTQVSALAFRPGVALLRASRSRPLAARPAPAPWVRPVAAGVNSPFGQRWGRLHKGLDFAAPYGAPISAIGDGVVVGAGYQPEEGGYGQITLIRHANGFVSAYAHQSRMLVHVGDHVRAGQVIGFVGATGHVTGPHLHFEIRRAVHGGQLDPRPWLRAHGVVV